MEEMKQLQELKQLQERMLEKALNKDNTIVMEVFRLDELIKEMESETE